ncbi:hypothetical protein Ancab_005284 [Ancistrocladus abbreviatus]
MTGGRGGGGMGRKTGALASVNREIKVMKRRKQGGNRKKKLLSVFQRGFVPSVLSVQTYAFGCIGRLKFRDPNSTGQRERQGKGEKDREGGRKWWCLAFAVGSEPVSLLSSHHFQTWL